MRRSGFLLAWLILGFVFLYVPIVLMVAMSFNDSRMTTVWTGVSLRWYRALVNDPQLLRAAMLSLGIAAASASVATLLGGLAGLALARFARIRLRSLFALLLAAPLVLPDLLLGVALLLLFVALERATGWPAGRGALTIVLAHATVGLAFVSGIVAARLAGGGIELEQAAADLGAPPFTAFRRITLPMLAPALGSGWLLAFVLSLDDVVIASLVGGPGATTLPMQVFSALRLGPTPILNALATFILVLAACLLFAAWKLGPASRRLR